MKRHIFCHGHGEIAARSLNLYTIPGGAHLVVYAPPGAAMADNYASEVQTWKPHARYSKSGDDYADHFRYRARLVRRSATPSSEVIPPLPIDCPSVTQSELDFILTGDSSLSYSGVYLGDQRLHKLRNNVSMSLSEVCTWLQQHNTLDQATYLHWLACASDHAGPTAQLRYSGFKIQT